MKLAFCLFKYFPYGGLQRDFLRIARTLRERGHDIHVYTMQWEGEPEPEFQLHIIKVRSWQNHTRIRSFTEALKPLLAKEDYDQVIGFNKMPHLDIYYAADVCYQARVHGRGWWYRLTPRYRQHVAFEASIFARGKPTQIMLLSQKQQKEFIEYYQTEPERFYLLPPGIAKDRVATNNAKEIRERVRKSYQLSDDQFLLLLIGSGFKTKGLDRAIMALSSLPADLKARCHLFVIGQDDPSRFQTLAEKQAVSDRIHFLGGRPDIPDFLLSADLMLHPAYHENTGTVLLEALVAGLPVLTTANCGYAHYVQEANAGMVLTSPFQQADLNAALQNMLLTLKQQPWQANGLAFAKNPAIYSLPEKAADLIENTGSLHTQAFTQSENFVAKNNLYLHDDIQKHLSPSQPFFEQIMALRGECFRHQKGRLTQRIKLGEQRYFIKQHSGVGWKEIIKNILQFRLPVLGAKNEWRAIKKLHALKVLVPEVLAYGERGINPSKRESFILMQELTPIISLEDLCKHWQTTPPAFSFKQKLIAETARIARTLHQNGLNHRDFYICHFLLDVSQGLKERHSNNIKLYLIDLHRVQIRHFTPKRWIIKDLAGLYFSSKDIGLTQRDLYRFMRLYCGKSLRNIFSSEQAFWQKVKIRGEQLYRDHIQ